MLRDDFCDGLLWVLLHIHEHLLSIFLCFVPLGHIKGSFRLLKSLKLFHIFNHKFLVL